VRLTSRPSILVLQDILRIFDIEHGHSDHPRRVIIGWHPDFWRGAVMPQWVRLRSSVPKPALFPIFVASPCGYGGLDGAEKRFNEVTRRRNREFGGFREKK
jgi:hypothetical protein